MINRTSTPQRHSRARSIGVAIGRDVVCAVGVRGGAIAESKSWTRVIAPPTARNTEWPELVDALTALRAEFGNSDAPLDIALLPPLLQMRVLEMPRMRTHEVERVLTRDATRYFVGARERQIVVARVLTSSSRSPVSVLAATASATIVETIHHAATAAGWRIDRVVPAYDAWAAGAAALWPTLRTGTGHLALCFEDRVEVLGVSQGSPTALRRVLPNTDATSVRAAIVSSDVAQNSAGTSMLALVGDEALRSDTAARIEATADAIVELLPESDSELVQSPEALAAAFAHAVRHIEFVPDGIAKSRRHAAAVVTAALTFAAMLLVGLAGALELWGVHREFNAVALERRRIAARVAAAMNTRRDIEDANARLNTLAQFNGSGPTWSRTLVTIAEELPQDTYLVAWRGVEDSVVLEGVASRAARAFEAIERAPGVAGVRSQAPVRQGVDADGASVERFAIAARLVRDTVKAKQ